MKSKIFIISILAALSSSCSKPELKLTDNIRINQCGYITNMNKMAFTTSDSKKFTIIDTNDDVVFEGETQEPQYWAESGDTIRQIIFDELQTEGNYRIVLDNNECSHSFVIASHPYTDIAKASAKAFYYNRASMPIKEEYGGIWNRPMGHPDTCVLVHSSAASKVRPEGTKLCMPGGWYDAGDYNKYIVNSGISTYTMLLTIQLYDSLSATYNLNIPESTNGLPDILDETLYNLRWMLTMQDPNDGGVYHKLTALNFEDFIMPNECKKQRYVVQKGTAATLDFAATTAFASRILRKYDNLSQLADSCLLMAKEAYKWAESNPNVSFRNPADVSTGEYGDMWLTDEWFWASVELMISTNDEKYKTNATQYIGNYNTPSWGSVGMLGHFSLALNNIELEQTDSKNLIIDIANKLLLSDNQSPINLSMRNYYWGSNSSVANDGMLKLIAYKLSGDKNLFESSVNDLHYILGRNGTGYCYVTGFGSKHVMNIHHRQSASDGIAEPVPGFLSGGPNTSVPNDCGEVSRSQYPAKAFADQECSYSTNEIAINWNAPLVFLTFGIESNL